ncbi:hypothetical protein [Nocardioides abyssi]|uniref:Lipoprotein n=1 Tax=Nocardioides abyssi TaxID=3058370 RepID=A0ABT8EQP1_9ACTN|nr:hypothetical protein [Nocardioides abyssi]MDN4160468.1 hypothetical protein [Nocardioides abyssi]
MSARRVLVAAAALVLAGAAGGLAGCDDDPPGRRGPAGPRLTGELVPVTSRALAAVTAPHVDLELEGVYVDPRSRRYPTCPGHRRVTAEIDFRGADVYGDLVVGRCPGEDRWGAYCDGRPPPARLVGVVGPRRGADLRHCTRTVLADGSEVHAGIQVLYQEGRYRVVQRYAEGWRLAITHRTDQDVRIPAAQLVAAVSDPALGPLVDAAYVEAGRALPSGGER